MWFMNGNRTEIVNTDYVERFVIVKKDDAVLICASYSETRVKTVARYRDEKEACSALSELLRAISENADFYFVDGSTGGVESQNSETRYHGRKRKNWGGS